jgi:sterol desaturase/sphingolipid hydroxylase (fatty acid hydroxylase superfamily)
MAQSARTQLSVLVLWAIAWAAAMIVSAILLKGNPIKDWIQSALFIAAMSFWVWQSHRAARS